MLVGSSNTYKLWGNLIPHVIGNIRIAAPPASDRIRHDSCRLRKSTSGSDCSIYMYQHSLMFRTRVTALIFAYYSTATGKCSTFATQTSTRLWRHPNGITFGPPQH